MNHDSSTQAASSSETQGEQASVSKKDNKWEKILKSESSAEHTVDSAAVSDSEENASEMSQPSVEALMQRVEIAEQEAAEARKQMQYLEAAMQTQRLRGERDLQQAKKYAGETTIDAFLPLLDGLDGYEKSLESSSLTQLKEGIERILALMNNIFEKLGVKVVDPAIGEVFDPHFHAAMMMEASPAGQASNTIIRVLQKGYQLHDRIMRPAMVVVSKTTES